MSPAHPNAGYLLDTNVLSELMRPAPAQEVLRWFGGVVSSQLHTSAINQAEILAGIAALPAGRRRDALALAAQEMFEDEFAGRCLAFGSTAAERFALVTAARKRARLPIDAVDAQIAAIALAAQFGLVTRNTRDFEGIEGLEVINPWQPH
jgi:predicted nucleic acid-binding protein